MLRNMSVSEKQINKMMHDNPISLMIKEQVIQTGGYYKCKYSAKKDV